MVSMIRSITPALSHRLHVLVRHAPLGLEPGSARAAAARAACRAAPRPTRGRGDRHQVRLGEVAVVLGLLLDPAGRVVPSCLLEVPGLLDDRAARVEHRGLPLISYRTARSTRAQRVDVLGLAAGAELLDAVRRSERFTSHRIWPCSIRASDTPRARISSRSSATYALATSGARAPVPVDRLGDDLDQRDAGPVVVDQRVLRAVDAAGGPADVRGLAGVLLHVRALDLDPAGLAVVLDVEVAVDAIGSSYCEIW